MKKRILLLTTGGTIASQDGGNGLAPVLSSDDFLDYMKEFEDVCELVPYEVCSIDSTNMEASWWLKLAGLIQKNYTLYDAFLICHGTDTMAYTAAALSYLIQNSVKPIVLTGAQKSILQEITDARKNLHDSIRCALDDRSRDVMLVFDGKLLRERGRKRRRPSAIMHFPASIFRCLGRFTTTRWSIISRRISAVRCVSLTGWIGRCFVKTDTGDVHGDHSAYFERV